MARFLQALRQLNAPAVARGSLATGEHMASLAQYLNNLVSPFHLEGVVIKTYDDILKRMKHRLEKYRTK